MWVLKFFDWQQYLYYKTLFETLDLNQIKYVVFHERENKSQQQKIIGHVHFILYNVHYTYILILCILETPSFFYFGIHWIQTWLETKQNRSILKNMIYVIFRL
jgi:hypothetical protein